MAVAATHISQETICSESFLQRTVWVRKKVQATKSI